MARARRTTRNAPIAAAARLAGVAAVASVVASLAVPLAASVAPRALAAQPLPAPAGATFRSAAPPPDETGAGLAEWRAEMQAATQAATQATAGSAQPRARKPAPWWAVAASAVVPGAGQVALRQPHGVAYAAVEAYTWLQYLESKRFSNRQRDEYRRIAREFARRDAGGTRPDGDWDYYERLEKVCVTLPFQTRCPSSGAYDATPGGALDPETDLATYNGQIWAIARETYWLDPNAPPPRGSPQFASALAYYERRADRPEFAWSWIDQQGALREYRTAIDAANSAWRDAITDRGVIVANHILSTVDAFVTVRMRRYGSARTGEPQRTGFEATIPWAPFGRPGGGGPR